MRALVCLFNSMNKVNPLLESRPPFSKEVSQTSYHIYIMLKWLKKIFCLWSWYLKIRIILKLLSNADLLRQTCVRPHIIKLKWTAHWNTCIHCYLCKPAYLQCLDVYKCKLLCILLLFPDCYTHLYGAFGVCAMGVDEDQMRDGKWHG